MAKKKAATKKDTNQKKTASAKAKPPTRRTAKKKAPPSNRTQSYLDEDMAPPKIDRIERITHAYEKAMAERISKLAEEVELKGKLIKAMQENHLDYYETRKGYKVSLKEIEASTDVKVKAPPKPVETKDPASTAGD